MQHDPKELVDVELHVDPVLISAALARVPAEIAFVGARLAAAEADLLRADHAAEREEARTYLSLRADAEIGGEKHTEARLRAQVVTAQSVMLARAEAVTARAARDRLRTLFDAVKAKQFVAGSIAANLRAEMGLSGGHSPSRPTRASSDATPSAPYSADLPDEF